MWAIVDSYMFYEGLYKVDNSAWSAVLGLSKQIESIDWNITIDTCFTSAPVENKLLQKKLQCLVQ